MPIQKFMLERWELVGRSTKFDLQGFNDAGWAVGASPQKLAQCSAVHTTDSCWSLWAGLHSFAR